MRYVSCCSIDSYAPTPLNILLTNATDIFAGGEEYVYTLARYLSQRGHSVSVSARHSHLLLKKCQEDGIATVPVQYGDMGKLFSVGAMLRAEIRRRSIDIIHSNANYDRTAAALAAVRTRAKHVTTVHSAHSIQHNITHWCRNKFGTAHFIAVADAVQRVLIEEDGIAREKITFIPNGVESDTPSFIRNARQRTRDAWNIAPDTVVIGNVARLVPFKGHKFLLESITEVVKTTPNVMFPILGDGELLDELQQQAASLNIERHVRFLGFQDHLNELYPAFDIYCHSSIELAEEAFPLAILHALATGLPVVSTRVGGIGAMVRHGKSGFLTPPEQPKLLADALVTLIQNPDLRASMGRASFESFQEEFHASLMAERAEQVYQHARNVRKK
jgi:glycosyltransferase involved in cell wall biosynthesis